ncbi:helix-turn-helix transcriptional regulator [Xanthomonas theicola]|nr:helix-turn-helix transcriptional regulator [Xanthomonas theicola]
MRRAPRRLRRAHPSWLTVSTTKARLKDVRTNLRGRRGYTSPPPAEVSVRSKLYERVREARKLTHLTQEALALDLAVTRSAVAQWEMAGGTAPAVEHLIALARRSGMTFEYLATGRGERVFGEPLSLAEEAAHYRQLSDQQARLLEGFEKLSPRQRVGLLDLIGAGKNRR